MGIVWLARDQRLDRDVAVKQLLIDGSAWAQEATARAMREGRIAGRLRHPNAIAVYDVVEHQGWPCLVMEYLPSESLANRVGLRPRQLAAIGAQLASALAAAHEAGIVHRDVKPDNVLITPDGTAKITDFGVSRAKGDTSVTATGILAGTPAYLAPEVARGAEADSRSDVFSLGATLYAMLEGEPPFGVDGNAIALLHKVAKGTMNPPRRAGELTGALLWLLHRDPTARPTMAQAEEILAAAADGRSVAPPSPKTPTLMLPAPRRFSRRAVVAGVSAAALVAAGIVVGVLVSDSGETTGSLGTPLPATSVPTSAPPPAAPACTAAFAVGNTWPDGYEAAVTVRNESDQDVTGWELTWTMPEGHEINNLWGGKDTQDGTSVTVTNDDYNVTIAPGASAEVGMTVDASDESRNAPTVECREQ
ncbi:protein kinase [Actinophytocola sp. S1-96]|uniref:non-specific serine/threonine protein kinase n=2 Tax=Actinophytocola gossypii TaxID=2812003 RepID=A0ABT2J283_9PSEU|nr:protein kinase [Actinophytocola gossypii]